MQNDDFIGMCVYGDTDEPAMISFDGEFEGLSHRKDDRLVNQYLHPEINIKCNYEQNFDDRPRIEAAVDFVLE